MSSKDLVVEFLNVGQGDATHIVFPNGEHMLVDMNLDRKNGGIDVVKYLEDVLPKGKQKPYLAIFVNTHPHDDHLRGIGDLHARVEIGEVWHSGHELDYEKDECPSYDEFCALLKDKGTNAVALTAKADAFRTIGGVTVHVYRPSKTVKKKKSDTDEQKAVHDECVVLKLTYGGASVMLTGDSDMDAWKSIVKHYERDLGSKVLSASHHGSRTFFKAGDEKDEAYTAHLKAIGAKFVVLSVGSDNPHGHPHADMLTEYKKQSKVYRTDEHSTVVTTVTSVGTVTITCDDADFQNKYQLPAPDDEQQDTHSDAAKGFGKAATLLSSRARLGEVSKTA